MFMVVILAKVAHARNRATPSTTHTARERKALSQPQPQLPINFC